MIISVINRSTMIVDKNSFLEHLEAVWRQWNGAYTLSLNKTGMIENRALKDIIAHVTWVVLETNGMLSAQALVGSDLWRVSEDERNERVKCQKTLVHVLLKSLRQNKSG